MMDIGFLGAGSWGFCLATLLAKKGYRIKLWTSKQELVDLLNQNHEHPHLPGHRLHANIQMTTDLKELQNQKLLIESVTSAGIRPVFNRLKSEFYPETSIILTSKGIEQNTGYLLPEVLVDIFGEEKRKSIGFLSGPSFSQEVIQGLPTSVVGTGYSPEVIKQVCETFSTETFRVYPNNDLAGVAFGGALKNIIAIACGISEGLGLGLSSRAALMTRGLHEIRKLAVAKGCRPETVNGLSGMGDLCLTCGSMISRNYRFGYFIAQGMTPKDAEKKIEMVIEGAYTCVSTLQLSKTLQVLMPITEIVYQIIYENLAPKEAVKLLMQRAIKEEHL